MNDGDREILDHFARTRDQTIRLAERVPEDGLARTAAGEEHTLGWLFAHCACGTTWWLHNVLRDGQPSVPERDGDKDWILDVLRATRDRFIAFFSADDGEPMGRTFSFAESDGTECKWVGRNRVLYLMDHEVHHRGKIVLALRQWGFKDIPFLPY
jgi:uncharacterized damage-inducible protein DinB